VLTTIKSRRSSSDDSSNAADQSAEGRPRTPDNDGGVVVLLPRHAALGELPNLRTEDLPSLAVKAFVVTYDDGITGRGLRNCLTTMQRPPSRPAGPRPGRTCSQHESILGRCREG
jgi:hypothetical protein